MCSGVVLFKSSNPLQELFRPSLFKQSHQRRAQCFGSGGRNFSHSRPGPCSLLHKAACDLLEFKVSSDIGGNEDVREFAIGHEQFGYEVDVPVVDSAVFLPRFLTVLEVAIFLEQLFQQRQSGSRFVLWSTYSLDVH